MGETDCGINSVLAITDSTDVSLSKVRELVMVRDARRAAVHGVAKSQTRLSDWTDLIPPLIMWYLSFSGASIYLLYPGQLEKNME